MPSPVIAPAPSAADIGLVVALPMEIGPFLDRLSRVRKYQARKFSVIEGELHGKIIVMVMTGMGRLRAQRGAETLLAGHRPRRLISAGYAGALNLGLKRNEIILVDQVLNIEGRRFPVDAAQLQLATQAKTGTLLTSDALARTALEKAELFARFEADIVDMETSSVAALAAERSVPFLSIRVVSDEAGIDLPREILTITGETGGVRLGATIGALWKRPGVLKELLKLREHAMEAADRLGGYLNEVVKTLE